MRHKLGEMSILTAMWRILEHRKLLQDGVLLIPRHENDDFGFVLRGRVEGLDRILHRAVAQREHRRAVCLRQCDANSSWQTPAQESAGGGEVRGLLHDRPGFEELLNVRFALFHQQVGFVSSEGCGLEGLGCSHERVCAVLRL